MKLQTNLPQNAAFYERYAELITSLMGVVPIAQFITGVCEIGILYGLIAPSFIGIIPPQYVDFVGMIIAVFCAAFLQISLKKLFPYAVRNILNKAFYGYHLALTVFISLLTICFLSAAIALSWQGAKEIADFAVSKPIEKTTTASDSIKNADFLTAQRLFSSDSATIETKYKGKIEATESEKMSIINAVERNAKGKKATTLRADLATKLAKLQADKATEIEAKATDRKKAMDRAATRNDGDAATIATDNTTAKNEVSTKKNRYKGYIGYFTLMCYIFFLSVFTMNEIYHKGAKIEIKPLPSQRHFNPSVFAEFIETVKEKLDVFFRTKIQNWADKTPPQPLPLSMSALYDYKADVLTDTIKIETTGKQTKVVKLPLKVHKIAAEISDETPEKPQRKIGFFGGNNDATKIVGGTNNDTNAVQNNDTIPSFTKIVGGKEVIGECPNCLKSFVKNHKKHTYCSDVCRIEFWQKKNGKAIHKNKTGRN